MGSNSRVYCLFCFFFMFTGFAASSSYISSAAFEANRLPGPPHARTLLQTLKQCSVNFENSNYTILTSKCKGPQYPPEQCCSAFKKFACPHAEEISDLTTDCANTMFSYITLYGKYPAGLFSSECKEGKNGLECEEDQPKAQKSSDSSSSFRLSAGGSKSPVSVVSLLVLLFMFVYNMKC